MEIQEIVNNSVINKVNAIKELVDFAIKKYPSKHFNKKEDSLEALFVIDSLTNNILELLKK